MNEAKMSTSQRGALWWWTAGWALGLWMLLGLGRWTVYAERLLGLARECS